MERVQLQGPRVLVRDLELDDLADVFAYACDDEVTRFMTWPTSKTPEDSRPFLEGAVAARRDDPRVSYELAVTLDGAVVGSIGLHKLDTVNKSAEMGYVIRRDLWGQGLMTEAAGLVIAFGFESLGLHRIYATHDPENIGSRRVMEKLGMKYEGLLRENLMIGGVPRDSELRAILRTD